MIVLPPGGIDVSFPTSPLCTFPEILPFNDSLYYHCATMILTKNSFAELPTSQPLLFKFQKKCKFRISRRRSRILDTAESCNAVGLPPRPQHPNTQ